MSTSTNATNATVLAPGQETVEPVGQSSQKQPIMETTPMQDHHSIPNEIVDLLRQDIPQNETVTENFADVVAEVREYYEYHRADLTMPNVKGSLKNDLEFFKTIGASKFILDVITNGYKLPFLHIPKRAFFNNNKSSITHGEFVSEAISELLVSDRIREIDYPPHVINPLSVSVRPDDKKRLILDLRYVNKCLRKMSVKDEDWKIALAYFQKNSYMISFDLKSGYHHIDIFEGHQFFLGFSWRFPGSSVSRFFVFTVLPFGLSVAPFIFTKCLKPLEKYWRLQAIFLDDGWVTENAFHACKDVFTMVRNDLSRAGFITNNSKSVWEPVQVLDWLGLRWNAIDATIHIIDRRLRQFFLTLTN